MRLAIGLFLLFTIVPSLELYLLLQIGAWLGPTQTFLLLLLSGVAGSWLARSQGAAVLRQLQRELESGLPPGSRVMEGVLVLVGGLLLITPGMITDVIGLTLIFPPTRRFIAPRAVQFLVTRLGLQVGAGPARAGAPPPQAGPWTTKFD